MFKPIWKILETDVRWYERQHQEILTSAEESQLV